MLVSVPSSRRRTACLAFLLTGCLACQATTPPPEGVAAAPPPIDLPELDEHSLLLLLADRQIYEGFVVSETLQGSAELRRDLAVSLGRCGASAARPMLERLLQDPDVDVRRAAIFGLGQLGEEIAARALLPQVASPDQRSGILAVEALAKLGADLSVVGTAAADLAQSERAARILPALFRFDSQQALLTAARGVASTDPALHAAAAYALARDAVPAAAAYLRPLLADSDPWVRGWAARGLGTVGDTSDLSGLRSLLRDDEAGPTIQALRAGRALAAADTLPPPGDWQVEIERLIGDPRPGVRVTAIEAATLWLPDERLGALLADRFANGSPREKQVAMQALAAAGDPRATDIVRRAAVDPEVQLRRRAATAASELGLWELLLGMLGDEHPAVRADALSALMEHAGLPGAEVADRALGDPSAAVRVVALRWLVEHPELPAERVLEALRPSIDEDLVELQVEVVRALSARSGRADAEAAVILDGMERMGRFEDFLVRQAVGLALIDMGVSPLEIGPASVERDLDSYGEIFLRTAQDRWARIETSRGPLTLRLACPKAPITCLSFLQLAGAGFYDGLSFHRVVPDFVVQTGDPSGGGWGGPGYSLRDEINRLRFETGVVGMAHSGPNSAGSQFFITLSPQPHLDGGYTVFGRVESGLEILSEIQQGDLVLSIREVAAPAGSASAGLR